MKQSRLAKRKMKKIQGGNLPKRDNRKLYFFSAGILFLFFVILGIWFLRSRSIWDGKSKISMALQLLSGETHVVILDPQASSITNIEIPGDTQIEASYELGLWKLGSLTRLGEDKGIGGVFLKNSVIKSFNFPIDSWGNANLLDLTSRNVFKMFQAVFVGGSTNLSVLDRIKISLFSFAVGNSGRNNLRLEDSSYLTRSQLPDGILGWKISDSLPSYIQAYFVNSSINASNINVLINDGSGGQSSMVARTLQVLGMNIASIQPLALSKFDCKVTGLNANVVQEVARIFSCSANYSKPSDNFDIQIDLGSYFNSRF